MAKGGGGGGQRGDVEKEVRDGEGREKEGEK